jgi:hypothetical protein
MGTAEAVLICLFGVFYDCMKRVLGTILLLSAILGAGCGSSNIVVQKSVVQEQVKGPPPTPPPNIPLPTPVTPVHVTSTK